MIKKNLFIVFIITSILAISFVFVLWKNNHSTHYLSSDVISEDTKKLLEDIDNDDNVFTVGLKQQQSLKQTSLYKNQICTTFQSKLTDGDLNEQIKLVQEMKRNLEDNVGVSDIVYNYVPRGLDDGYGSHALPLIVSALTTTGDILELGIGKYSTPALNKIAKLQKKFLLSTESDQKWMENFVNLNDSVNHLILSSNSDCANGININKRWGLVFVDHLQANTRHLDIIKYAEKAEIVIAHDSEKNSQGYYLYDKAYPYFTYHCKFSLVLPGGRYISTSVLSNYVSFESLKQILNKVETNLKHVVCDQNMKKRRK
jgi:hypothetical protein